ncbi:MAG TPA: ferritin-like domain-containing protein [Candidatus Angelobacter sp.]|nr:ferritin-like domain-containing protein [Candidatus Angelobacter sp.]
MSKHSLSELYVAELKDIYNAEQQLVEALPKLAKAAAADDLRHAFQEHLEETREQVARLEIIFEMIGQSPKGKKCMSMEGLVKEGAEIIDEFEDPARDAGLISAAQRVEHYEIAGYGSVIAYAELLGQPDAVSLLQTSLAEEKQADRKLTELAKNINDEANTEIADEHGQRVQRKRGAKRAA